MSFHRNAKLGLAGRRRSRARRRAHEDRGEREEAVGLDDHGKAAAVLNVTSPRRQRDRVNVTP
jgi:hypothetical protein